MRRASGFRGSLSATWLRRPSAVLSRMECRHSPSVYVRRVSDSLIVSLQPPDERHLWSWRVAVAFSCVCKYTLYLHCGIMLITADRRTVWHPRRNHLHPLLPPEHRQPSQSPPDAVLYRTRDPDPRPSTSSGRSEQTPPPQEHHPAGDSPHGRFSRNARFFPPADKALCSSETGVSTRTSS